MDDTLKQAVEKIRRTADQPGCNVERLAVQAGMSVATLYRVLRGTTKDLRYSTARTVIEFAATLPEPEHRVAC